MRADLAYALRSILRRPAHAALVVMTLALGLGVNTVAFSAVNALIFRPFAVTGHDQTGWVFVGSEADPWGSVSTSTFAAIQKATTLDAVAAEGRLPVTGSGPAGPEQLWALAVSPNYFSLVPAPLFSGRHLNAGDTSTDAVPVMVSERFWRARGDTDLLINGQRAAIVGVVADGHQGPGGLFEPQLWFTFDAMPLLRMPARGGDETGWLTMIGQPRQGASPAQVTAEIQALAEASTTGAARSRVRASYIPVRDGHPEAEQLATAMLTGLGAVGLVLLIACFNVAGLILARSTERQQELAIRASLGASRARLTRLLLAEGLVLATLAGAGALLLASWSEALLGGLSLPAPIPQRLHFSIDWRMVAFTAVLVLIAAGIPTIAPAMRISRIDPLRWLKAGATGASGASQPATARRWFIRFQVVGATTFLTLALLFVASHVTGLQTHPGFNTTHTAVMEWSGTNLQALADSVAARPEIAGVAVAERVSFHVGDPGVRQVAPDGRDCTVGGCTTVSSAAVSPTFFDTMEIAVLAGRTFRTPAAADAGAVIINRALADTVWPNGNALGQWITDSVTKQPRQVIGIVATVVTGQMQERPRPYLYLPFLDEHWNGAVTMVARSRVSGDAAARTRRDAWQSAHAVTVAASIKTMDARLALPLWPSRVAAAFFATCGIVAVLLVSVGLFGVTWHTVSQRTREFGIRLAIGATAGDLRRLVFSESLRLAGPALLVGLIVAAGVASIARALLPGVSALNPGLYLAAMLLQLGVILLACWSPALKASRVSPHITMKAQ